MNRQVQNIRIVRELVVKELKESLRRLWLVGKHPAAYARKTDVRFISLSVTCDCACFSSGNASLQWPDSAIVSACPVEDALASSTFFVI